MDTYRTFHPAIAEYAFFSRTHRTFAMKDHILGYKASVNKLKRIQVIHSVFSDHKGIKIKISNRVMFGQFPNIWKINNTLLHYPWAKEEFQREIRKCFDLNENENKTYYNFWNSSKAVLGRKFVVLNSYIKIKQRSQINDVSFYLRN